MEFILPVRCPCCDHVLFVARGLGGPPIEIKCHRCNVLVRWPSAVAELVLERQEDEAYSEPDSPSA